MTERVLCIAAHPDDETFGPGATLAKHAAAGDAVSIVVFADGLASRGGVTQANIAQRHGMCRRACKIIGTEDVWLHQYADNMMDNLPLLDVVKHVEIHLKRFSPTVVYTHWRGDLNVDHSVLHDAVNVACRPQPGCTVKTLLYFEVPCSTAWGGGFEPNYFVDVEETIEKKIEASKEYASELREAPHPRSLAGIARVAETRGSRIGIRYAEAFVIGRLVACIVENRSWTSS